MTTSFHECLSKGTKLATSLLLSKVMIGPEPIFTASVTTILKSRQFITSNVQPEMFSNLFDLSDTSISPN